MLNLLFISDSPKIEYIKNVLQPVLRVIIDVVPDFDHGLKDVFEKRPAAVCIQDQIAGITGESVARHIKMLLGAGAPSFILIHEGNGKAKKIKGLFEHIIDLNQPEAKLAAEIQSTLKILTGDQWDKIYIPPATSPVSMGALAAPSGEPRSEADKLVDDFLAGLEAPGFAAAAHTVSAEMPETADTQTDTFVTQTSDEILNEMQLEHDTQVRMQEAAAKKAAIEPVISKPDTDELAEMLLEQSKQSRLAEIPPAQPFSASGGHDSKIEEMVKHQTGVITTGQTPPATPAEFRIKHGKAPAAEEIPDDLLTAFEENYLAESNSRKRLVLVSIVVSLVVAAAAGWYFVQRNPDVQTQSKQQVIPVLKSPPVPVVTPPQSVVQPVPAEQKTAPPAVEKAPVIQAVPTFIPRDGLDKSFADKNPGWERYIGRQTEFRLFSADGRLKALQVLAVKGNVVPDTLVKTVLTELTGSPDYRITTRENKSGYLLLRGTVPQKADVLFYKKNSVLRAFVVSIH